MIDTHIHIDFYDEPKEIISDIILNDISAIFVTHLPELFDKHKEKFDEINQIFLAVGFHPILVNEYEFNEKVFIKALNETRFVGEVGLDYSVARSEKSKSKQLAIFNKICSCVRGHILSVHSRQAERDVFQILSNHKVENAIFHWYTGEKELIPLIVKSGYYFSINPSMLRTNKGRGILKEIPLDKILIETDGPFSKHNGHIVEPRDLHEIYAAFEEFYNVSDLDEIVYENLAQLIR